MENTILYDVAIIGGGINGAGIALEAASRGLKVLLCEEKDLAGATSSASSKLAHGGLRYLENREFRLVKEALSEREILLQRAPHIVKPLNFILPHRRGLRPSFLIRLGLFLYDYFSRNSVLPRSKRINLAQCPHKHRLKKHYRIAFQYSDCSVDDARLVIENAIAARELGATIFTYTRCTAAVYIDNCWQLTLTDTTNVSSSFIKRARVLINATGPWVESFLQNVIKTCSRHKMACIKGSHIVVKKFYEGNFAYVLQNRDRRVVFVIPYLSEFALIGTTDLPYTKNPRDVQIEACEIDYLIATVKNYFDVNLTISDIIYSYAGVRPLKKNTARHPAQNTRDYSIELHKELAGPLISIFGGKLTTYRSLSEKVLDEMSAYFPKLAPSATKNLTLPGGQKTDPQTLNSQYSWLPKSLLARYINLYGSRIHLLLDGCYSLEDLGQDHGVSLHQRELTYLVTQEWARNAEDVLWRRTKLGYFFPAEKIVELNKVITEIVTENIRFDVQK